MLTEDFQKLIEQYRKGMKKITHNSITFKIDKSTNEMNTQKGSGNYELYFNIEGRLVHSIHNESNYERKCTYGYNRFGELTTIINLYSSKNEVYSISNFKYDKMGRIEKEVEDIVGIKKVELNYTYGENFKCIFLPKTDERDDDAHFYEYYNEKKQLIEKKAYRNNDKEDLIWWIKIEYDENGNKTIEYDLNVDGSIDEITKIFLPVDGLRSGYELISDDNTYVRDIKHTFNERGDWISEVLMNDGVPLIYYERKIEYY